MARTNPETIRRYNDYQKIYMRQYRKDHPEQTILAKIKSRAKKQGIPFNLALDDIVIPEVCPILGVTLEFKRDGSLGPSSTSPSVDRVNPELGYVQGNVRIISNRANQLKNDMTIQQVEQLLFYMKN